MPTELSFSVSQAFWSVCCLSHMSSLAPCSYGWLIFNAFKRYYPAKGESNKDKRQQWSLRKLPEKSKYTNKVCICSPYSGITKLHPKCRPPSLWLPLHWGMGNSRQPSKSTTILYYQNVAAFFFFFFIMMSPGCCKIFIRFQSSLKLDSVSFGPLWLLWWKDQSLELPILPFSMTHPETHTPLGSQTSLLGLSPTDILVHMAKWYLPMVIHFGIACNANDWK